MLRPRLRDQIRSLPQVLRAPRFRILLGVHVLVSLVFVMANPFYTVFAVERLGAPAAMVGFYLTVYTLTSLGSNLVWPRLDRRLGREEVLRLSMGISVVVPLAALGLGVAVSLWPGARGAAPWWFALIFLMNGVAETGRDVAISALALDVSPADQRPTYLGFMSTVLGVTAFPAPLLAGWMADHLGYEWVFAVVAGLLAAGLWLADEFRSTAAE